MNPQMIAALATARMLEDQRRAAEWRRARGAHRVRQGRRAPRDDRSAG